MIQIRTTLLAVAAVAAFAVPALAESAICTVSAPEIRLRKGPSKKAKVIAILRKDTRVTTAKECAGGWVKVASEDGKLKGYVGGWALAGSAGTVAEAAAAPAAAPAAEAAPAAAVPKEIPSNEKLAMQITELRLNVLGIERDMQKMNKEIRKIKVALKRKGASKKVAAAQP